MTKINKINPPCSKLIIRSEAQEALKPKRMFSLNIKTCLMILSLIFFISLINEVKAQIVTEISSLAIASGAVVNDFAILNLEAGGTVPLYLTLEDTNIKDSTGGINSNSTLSSPLKIKCFDQDDLCIMSGDLVIKSMETTATSLTFDEFSYRFLKDHKSNPLVYNMEVEPIQGTSYFLSFITSNFGVLRYKFGVYTEFALAETLEDLENDRFARGLLSIRNSAHGLASVHNVDKIFNFDVTKMLKLNIFPLKSGTMVELTLDRAEHLVAKGEDSSISVFKYSDGTEISSLDIYYFITDIASVTESNFILTGEDNLLKVYDFDLATTTISLILTHNAVEPIYAVDFDFKSS